MFNKLHLPRESKNPIDNQPSNHNTGRYRYYPWLASVGTLLYSSLPPKEKGAENLPQEDKRASL